MNAKDPNAVIRIEIPVEISEQLLKNIGTFMEILQIGAT